MYDVVVIGAGMSGLMAAAAAVKNKKKVLVVAKGQGALSVSSGCIDFNIAKLQADYDSPFYKAKDIVEESFICLQTLVSRQGLIYSGVPGEQLRVLTTLGTSKNSCLVPESMVLEQPERYERIVAVGFKDYIDFSPSLFIYHIKKRKIFSNLKETLELHFDPGVEVPGNLWLAEALTGEYLKEKLLSFLKQHAQPATLFVFPALLGILPGENIFHDIEKTLKAKILELPGSLPSIPGQRLNKALISALKEEGVVFRFNNEGVGFKENSGRIAAIKVSEAGGKVREISAKSFVLATGSFWGGGLQASTVGVQEPIFNSDTFVPEDFADNFNFLESGIQTDQYLRPVKKYTNLFACGNILKNFNYLKNNSGLGLALLTGYKAGLLAAGIAGGEL